jgi:hypothetical protein
MSPLPETPFAQLRQGIAALATPRKLVVCAAPQPALLGTLRDYARTDPAWVRSFTSTHELCTLSRREALRHVP